MINKYSLTNFTKNQISSLFKQYDNKIEQNIKNKNSKNNLRNKYISNYTKDAFSYIKFSSNVNLSELFQHYEKTNFIYKEKNEKIKNFIELIKDNWSIALKPNNKFFKTYKIIIDKNPIASSISYWRSTNKSCIVQHLTSENSHGSKIIINKTLALLFQDNYQAMEAYYRPSNPYPARVFNKLINIIGNDYIFNEELSYLEVKPEILDQKLESNYQLIQCKNGKNSDLQQFIEKNKGSVYIKCEGIDTEDIELNQVDETYKEYNLRRRRYIWAALKDKTIIGAVLVYRGPFGLNLRFFENRCDLILDSDLNETEISLVSIELLKKASTAYFNSDIEVKYPQNFIPVLASERCANKLIEKGAGFITKYNHIIIMKEGYLLRAEYLNNLFNKHTNEKKIDKITENKKSKEYFMEHPDDNKRLAEKVDPRDFVNKYIKQYIHKKMSILEIGCGPGVIACNIAERFPDTTITTIDNSIVKINETKKNRKDLKNLYPILGDIYQIPFKDNSFNFVFNRFLFQYLYNKADAIKQMIRVCKPGGRVMIQELDGQLIWHYPEDEELKSLINESMKKISQKGFDPMVGRKIYNFCYNAGLKDIIAKGEMYHFIAGSINKKDYKIWDKKIDIAMSELIDALGDKNKGKLLKEKFLKYLQRKDTFTYSVVLTISGIKP